MRNQVLTEKRSSMSEQSKMAILTNELNRRFLMMDGKIDIEEKKEKVDQFTQQLINSGYAWQQIRDIVTSSLKGMEKLEMRQKENRERKYRTGAESLQSRIKKKLTEATEWYKLTGGEEKDDDREKDRNREYKEKSWKEWRRRRSWRKKKNLTNREKMEEEKRKIENGNLQGVLFVAHTQNSELAKRIRSSLENMEKYSKIKI